LEERERIYKRGLMSIIYTFILSVVLGIVFLFILYVLHAFAVVIYRDYKFEWEFKRFHREFMKRNYGGRNA
jgi:hypothetical protein